MAVFGTGMGGLPFAFSAFSPDDGQTVGIWGGRFLPASQSDEIIVAADGSGHFLTIAEAVTFLGGGSATIRVKDGDYLITTGISTGNNITIVGSGYGTKIYTVDNITLITMGTNCVLDSVRLYGNSTGTSQSGINMGSGSKVINVWIDNMGGNGGILSSNSQMSMCNITDCDGYGIAISGSFSQLVGNYIDNMGGEGIWLSTTTGCSVIGNHTSNHGYNGIKLNSAGQNLIQGNYSFSNGDAAGNYDGINLGADCNDNCISGNVFHTNDGRGIYITAATCNRNVLIGNSCLNNAVASITDSGTNTLPNGAVGTTNLQLDDLNYV